MVGKSTQKSNPKTKKKPVKEAKSLPASKKSSKKSQKPQKSSTWKTILTIAICIAIPLVVGFSSSAVTGSAMSKFAQFNQPPASPPAWLFPVAWSILYVLMGIASYFIYIFKPKTKKEAKYRLAAIILYFIQLAFNFAWSPIFFVASNYGFALMWLLVMWLMVIAIIFLIRERSMPAIWCLLPYALWCLFAMYLNVGVMLLN